MCPNLSKKGLARSAIVVIVIVVVIAAAGAGYWFMRSGGTEEEPVKVGFLADLSGPQSLMGDKAKRTVQMAEEEINNNGGIDGRPMEVIVEDTELKEDVGISAMKELILQEKVDVLAGIQNSSTAMTASSIVAQYKMPLLVTVAVSTGVTQPVTEDYEKYKYIFQTAWTNVHLLDMIVNAVDVAGAETYYWVAPDAAFTHALWEAAQPQLQEIGATSLGESWAPRDTQDFKVTLTKAKEEDPDMILALFPGSGGPLLLKQARRDVGIDRPIFTFTLLARMTNAPEQLGEDVVENVYFVATPWDREITSKTKDFYDKWESEYEDPLVNYEETRAYDTMYIIRDAIERAGSTDSDEIVSALEETDYVGICGRYQFTDRHDVKYGEDYVQPLVGVWHDSQATIVYP